jgi:ABC-type sugar transport system ATPase subunit
MSDAMISVAGLHKSYRMGRVDLHVLRGVSFAVARGEFVSIVGASGSGKSTLLHLMGLLDRPDKGTVHVDGRDTSRLGAGGRTRMRRDDIGFVFQFYHLLPELNVLENVQIAQMTGPGLVRWLRFSTAWGSRAGSSTGPASYRAGSASAWPWPAPWSTPPRCSWPMNPRATSTGARAGRSSR